MNHHVQVTKFKKMGNLMNEMLIIFSMMSWSHDFHTTR